MSFREGRYADSLAQADALQELKPGAAADIVALRPLLEALSRYPNLRTRRKRSDLPFVPAADPNPHFPVQAEGKQALFFADTGANISVMSDAEAHALGLTVVVVSTKLGDVSGTLSDAKVAVVNRLQIGNCVLRHVAFTVVPGSQPPFNAIPVDQQGLLGIEVLLALRRIHIEQDGRIELAGKRSTGHATPLALDQFQPVVQMSFGGTPLVYTLDTGAVHTTLNPLFGTTFHEALRGGVAGDHALTGFGGTTTQSSLHLPRLEFSLAEVPVTLAPAVVLSKQTTSESKWAAGNLGYDLIKQAAPFTIDFGRMTLSSSK